MCALHWDRLQSAPSLARHEWSLDPRGQRREEEGLRVLAGRHLFAPWPQMASDGPLSSSVAPGGGGGGEFAPLTRVQAPKRGPFFFSPGSLNN